MACHFRESSAVELEKASKVEEVVSGPTKVVGSAGQGSPKCEPSGSRDDARMATVDRARFRGHRQAQRLLRELGAELRDARLSGASVSATWRRPLGSTSRASAAPSALDACRRGSMSSPLTAPSSACA